MSSSLFKKLALGLMLCAPLGSAFADYLTTDQKTEINTLKTNALASTLAYDLDESLTTEVGPRMIGSPGDKASVRWAQDKMKALGFDKVWTEPVNYTFWERGVIEAKILAPYPQNMVALALGGSVGTPAEGLKAQVAHFKTFADLQAAQPGSLKGKIAFVSYRMARKHDGSGYGPAVGARVNGAVAAAEKGAVGFIMRSVGSDDNRVAHTGIMRYKDGVKKIPAATLSNPDADLLVRQLKRGKPVKVFLKMTAKPEDSKTVVSANVIGEIRGTENPEQVVVLGAHLDTWDVGTGALDDGIGVGITMAAAHFISKLPQRPKRTIRVILFAGEEVGLVGADAYLKKHADDIVNHVIGVEWDFANGPIYDMLPGVGPEALNAIRELAGLLAPMGVSLNPLNNGKGSSDIRPIVAAGMPAMNFHADGLDYFDHHHTENDTLDKVDQVAIRTNAAIYAMFAYFAANTGVDFRK